MKSKILLLVALFVVVACSKEEVGDVPPTSEAVRFSYEEHTGSGLVLGYRKAEMVS